MLKYFIIQPEDTTAIEAVKLERQDKLGLWFGIFAVIAIMVNEFIL